MSQKICVAASLNQEAPASISGGSSLDTIYDILESVVNGINLFIETTCLDYYNFASDLLEDKASYETSREEAAENEWLFDTDGIIHQKGDKVL